MTNYRKFLLRYVLGSMILFLVILIINYTFLPYYLIILTTVSLIGIIFYSSTLFSFKILKNLTDYYINYMVVPEYEKYKKKQESGELDTTVQIIWRM